MAAPLRAELASDVRGLRRVEYEQLVQAGAFADEHVELLEGLIVKMAPHGPLHDGTLQILVNAFRSLPGSVQMRIQSAFAASDGSEPEPDLALVPAADYRREHPTSALLVAEVADSSLRRDLEVKPRIYASSGVAEYWVVNVQAHVVVVFRDPTPRGYTRRTEYRSPERVALEGLPGLGIEVASLFESC